MYGPRDAEVSDRVRSSGATGMPLKLLALVDQSFLGARAMRDMGMGKSQIERSIAMREALAG